MLNRLLGYCILTSQFLIPVSILLGFRKICFTHMKLRKGLIICAFVLLLIYLVELLSFINMLSLGKKYAGDIAGNLWSYFHLINGSYCCRIGNIILGTPLFYTIYIYSYGWRWWWRRRVTAGNESSHQHG